MPGIWAAKRDAGFILTPKNFVGLGNSLNYPMTPSKSLVFEYFNPDFEQTEGKL
jgi:hypothetical protein